jgi:hypothetical protein
MISKQDIYNAIIVNGLKFRYQALERSSISICKNISLFFALNVPRYNTKYNKYFDIHEDTIVRRYHTAKHMLCRIF